MLLFWQICFNPRGMTSSKKLKKTQAPRSRQPAVVLVIPARLGSTRLPEKPLIDLEGKPMLQRTWEQACQVRGVSQVVVATDHEKIAQRVRQWGGTVHLSSPDLPKGTDRVAAVARDFSADIYINFQGDEPLLAPRSVEQALALVVQGKFLMSTLATSFRTKEDFENLGCVKVLLDRYQRALYFSRWPIPYSRQPLPADLTSCKAWQHLGLYVYRRDLLFLLESLPMSPLEEGESLEQLRALEQGVAIGVVCVPEASIGVDTPADVEKVRSFLKQQAAGKTTYV